MANSTWRANSSTGLPLTTSFPNSLPYPAMRNSTDTRRGRRGADGQRLANRKPQKKMSGTSKAKGKGSSGVGKNRDEMKKADHARSEERRVGKECRAEMRREQT